MSKKNLFFTVLFVTVLISSCATKQAKTKVMLWTKTEMDSVSYAFGLLNGRSFVEYINDTDSGLVKDEILNGFRDAINGVSDSLYNANATLFELWAKNKEQKSIDAVKQKEQKILDDNRSKPGVITTLSGLQYKILRSGSGDKPSVQDTVFVDYEGRLSNGTVFDSSYKRGEPAKFSLRDVIPGWVEGICLMPVGSKYQFYIPSSLAYGDNGAGDVIPPYSTLIFDVELKSINKYVNQTNKEVKQIKKSKRK